MGEVLLWSFQPAARVAELHATGQLVGAWEYVPSGLSIPEAYGAMVAAMERAGLSTQGRPPVWTWGGSCGVAVEDAHMLVGDPPWEGYVTLEFSAPAELVLASDYGVWNDYLYNLADGVDPVPRWDVPTPIADKLVQVCLPFMRAEWVREVRPLPRSPDEVTDRAARA
ncbi:DUF3841 domain-containing protein [Pseudonocardia sp. DSM 110487]|uniref:DUF3841 domain-containing protein n=1 Tax=Pseudonocardia sp. DSM 110487 TaxID=2865833 RepID=UPI001C6A2E73|nr:DUF3841 domain-containing protein [Pseudonocardia sp. DSM 110487]QYN36660.1 DUF3841 domain-containing protein [Pseudonocardia sp. DSM 110487]